jgi:hypothetical protein
MRTSKRKLVYDLPSELIPTPNTPEDEARYQAEDHALRQAKVLRLREFHEQLVKLGIKPEGYWKGSDKDGKIVYEYVKYY